MSQPVAISTVLRTVPSHLLQRWFDDHVPGQLPTPIKKLSEREIEPLLAFHAELPLETRNEMDIDLQTVHSFANEAGMNAFNDGAKLHHVTDLMQRIPDDLDLHGRAMWVRVYEPEIFKSSFMFLQLEQSQFWRRRNDVPAELTILPDAEEKLSSAISALLRCDGRGLCTSVETIKRPEVIHFIVYTDDYVRRENTHDANGKLMSIAIRPTVQIIFAYYPLIGAMQMATSIKQPRKAQLEPIFAETVLGWELGLYESGPAYELGHLKDPNFDLVTDPADNIRARIEGMAFFNTQTNRPVSVSVDRKNPDDTIQRAIEEELSKQPGSQWHRDVKSVDIRIWFPTSQHHRASSPTIKVTPRSCNVARLTSDRAEIVQRHLRMWGIDHGAGEQSALAAMGG
ncbi:hypothetical protein SH528x_003292 [Novipirellula sp. SH528]|uniref:hypothetical protein n=1 Tax=Novipirellula sp. SH528 TaxID=3454466 RepID=UPI003FA12D9B